MKVVQNRADFCQVQVGDSSSGIGNIDGYIKNGEFCMHSYGAYFTNAGLKESTECVPISGGDGGSGPPSAASSLVEKLSARKLEVAMAIAAIIAGLTLIARNRRTKRE